MRREGLAWQVPLMLLFSAWSIGLVISYQDSPGVLKSLSVLYSGVWGMWGYSHLRVLPHSKYLPHHRVILTVVLWSSLPFSTWMIH